MAHRAARGVRFAPLATLAAGKPSRVSGSRAVSGAAQNGVWRHGDRSSDPVPHPEVTANWASKQGSRECVAFRRPPSRPALRLLRMIWRGDRGAEAFQRRGLSTQPSEVLDRRDFKIWTTRRQPSPHRPLQSRPERDRRDLRGCSADRRHRSRRSCSRMRSSIAQAIVSCVPRQAASTALSGR
jgi:hypothetical protein